MYIGGIPENKHYQRHTTPNQTLPPTLIWTTPTKINNTKTDSYTNRPLKNDIHNTHHHYWTPKDQPSKRNTQSSSPNLSHIRTTSFLKIIQLPPPLNLRSTKRTPNKAQNQTWTKELTPDLESKVIGPPDFRIKSEGHPKLKQELATTDMDPSNRGNLQKKSPITNTTKTPTSSPKQHQPPPYIAPVRKVLRLKDHPPSNSQTQNHPQRNTTTKRSDARSETKILPQHRPTHNTASTTKPHVG